MSSLRHSVLWVRSTPQTSSDQLKFYPVVKKKPKHLLPFVHLLCKYCLFVWILIMCVAIKGCRMCLYCVSRSDSFAEWRGDRPDDKGVSLQTLRVFSNPARKRATEDSERVLCKYTEIKKKNPGVDDYFVVLCSNAFSESPFLTCVHVFYVFLQQMQQQNPQKVEASKVPEYIKKAAKKAAEFNSNFNRERMEERRAYFDLQTHVSTALENLILLSDVLWDKNRALCTAGCTLGGTAEFLDHVFGVFLRLSKFPRADSRCWLQSWQRRVPTLWLSYQDSSKNTTRGTLETLPSAVVFILCVISS